jgi:hypothetical protein
MNDVIKLSCCLWLLAQSSENEALDLTNGMQVLPKGSLAKSVIDKQSGFLHMQDHAYE